MSRGQTNARIGTGTVSANAELAETLVRLRREGRDIIDEERLARIRQELEELAQIVRS